MYYKNVLNENLTFVKLSSTNYPNVKFDLDGTKDDLVNEGLLDDLQKAAASVGIVVTITTAKTGHSENVKGTKRRSRHMNGTAVDISVLNGIGSGGATNSNDGNPNFRNLGNKLKDALVSMGYKWNRESGNDKAVLWQTNIGGNHYNHLHVSNKAGQSLEEPEPKEKKEDTSDEGLAATLLGIANEYVVEPTISKIGGVLGKSEFLKILRQMGSDVEKKYEKLTPAQKEMWEQNEKLKKIIKKIL